MLNTSNLTLSAGLRRGRRGADRASCSPTGGIVLRQLTGSPVPHAVGSILVGVLLSVVAVVLIDRNRRFLVGENVPYELRNEMLENLLRHPDVDRVTYLHLEFLGPRKLYLVAAVDMAGDDAEHDLAVRLRRLEHQLELVDLVEEAVLTLATSDEPPLRV